MIFMSVLPAEIISTIINFWLCSLARGSTLLTWSAKVLSIVTRMRKIQLV